MGKNKKSDGFLGLKWTERQLSQLENEIAAENQKNLVMVSQISVFYAAARKRRVSGREASAFLVPPRR